MSTIPPPLFPPALPKPPGLGSSQKTLIVLAVMVSIALFVAMGLFIYWVDRVERGAPSDNPELEQAKQRQAQRAEEYNKALAALPAGTLPPGWSTRSALDEFALGDLDAAHQWSRHFFDAGCRFDALGLAWRARALDSAPSPTPFDLSLDPRTRTAEQIEQGLLEFLRGSNELKQICTAARNGLYHVDFDLGSSKWSLEFDESGRDAAGSLLALRAVLEARWGGPGAALDAYLDAVTFAELAGAAPFVSFYAARYDLEWRADFALWEFVGKEDPTDDVLARLNDAFARRHDTARLKEIAIEEADLEFHRTMNGEMEADPVFEKIARMTGMHNPEQTHKAAIDLASSIDKPFAEMRACVDRINDGDYGIGVDMYTVASDVLGARMAQLRSALVGDALRVALALKRSKADTGAYPAALAELVPAYTDAVPIDPVTGRVIEYLRWREGYFLFAPREEVDEDDSYSYYDADEPLDHSSGFPRDTLWYAER